MIKKKQFDVDHSNRVYSHLRDEVQKNIIDTRKSMSKAIEGAKLSLYLSIGRLLHECKTALAYRLPKDLHAALAKDIKDSLPWIEVGKDLSSELKWMEGLHDQFMDVQFRPELSLPYEYKKMMADFASGYRNTKTR